MYINFVDFYVRFSDTYTEQTPYILYFIKLQFYLEMGFFQ